MEYVGIDGMNIDVVQNAIERCADSNIRNFYYLDSILRNWSKKGIKTLEQVDEEDKKFQESKRLPQRDEDLHSIVDPDFGF